MRLKLPDFPVSRRSTLRFIVFPVMVAALVVVGGSQLWLRDEQRAWEPYAFDRDAITWKALPERSAGAIRFAVIGDFGTGGDYARYVAEMVQSWEPDFIITTGDNNYPDGTAGTIDAKIGQFYSGYIYPYQGTFGEGGDTNRFFPSLGNHDWHTEGVRPHLDYFTLPGNERYYDFVWGPVHFFAVDSDDDEPDGHTRTSKQARWLEERLAASESPWKIVYMHHPPYSSAHHGSQKDLQWPYQDWGASVVLAGHDHTYERIMREGFPYFVNGLGGAAIYRFKTPVEGSVVRYNEMHGAMLVEATAQSITFEFYSIEDGGTLVDRFTLEADSGGN